MLERYNFEVGDRIICKGIEKTVTKVLGGDAWTLEALDQDGKYFSWHPEVDGGKYIKKGE